MKKKNFKEKQFLPNLKEVKCDEFARNTRKRIKKKKYNNKKDLKIWLKRK